MGRHGAYLQVLERSGVALGGDAIEHDGLPHQHLYQRHDLNFGDLISLGDRFVDGRDLVTLRTVCINSLHITQRKPFEI